MRTTHAKETQLHHMKADHIHTQANTTASQQTTLEAMRIIQFICFVSTVGKTLLMYCNRTLVHWCKSWNNTILAYILGILQETKRNMMYFCGLLKLKQLLILLANTNNIR